MEITFPTLADIQGVVATGTATWTEYFFGSIGGVFKFAIIVGVVFMVIRWIINSIRGHGFRA